ncbi:MAG: hypothetical protein PVJ76_16450 [Gemmatimonadota bacterium]|jgi:hypothetical protein
MRNPTRFLSALLVFLAACQGNPSRWTGEVVEEGGILHVRNPAQPLAQEGQVTVELLWSETGSSGNDLWEVPNKLRVAQGTVFLVDRQASRIHRVSLEGETLASFGEPGGGPGQYQRIIDAVPTQAGLFVVDGGNGRVEILSYEGEIRASHSLDRIVFLAEPLGPEAITLFYTRGGEPEWGSMDEAGSLEPHPFPDFQAPEGHLVPVSVGSTWEKNLVRLRYATPQIRLYSLDGHLEKEIMIPLPPMVATDAEVEELVLRTTGDMARVGIESDVIEHQAERIRARSRDKLSFRKIRFDDEGRLAGLWQQNPEDFGSGPATLHLLSIDGIYLARLEFDRPWADFDLSGARLFVLSRDPVTDLATLQAFDLRLPEGLMAEAESIARSWPPFRGPAGS